VVWAYPWPAHAFGTVIGALFAITLLAAAIIVFGYVVAALVLLMLVRWAVKPRGGVPYLWPYWLRYRVLRWTNEPDDVLPDWPYRTRMEAKRAGYSWLDVGDRNSGMYPVDFSDAVAGRYPPVPRPPRR
jgi:hypothetical protein